MAEISKADELAAEAAMSTTESAQTAAAAPPSTNAGSQLPVVSGADTSAAEAAMASTESAQSASAAPRATGTAEKVPASSTNPSWPDIAVDSPLAKLLERSIHLTREAQYDEVYGIHLNGDSRFHRKLILQKFLRANANDVEKASTQLLNTLKWRKSFRPLGTLKETYSNKRFGGLGYIISVDGVPESPNKTDIVCLNVYGNVKDNKNTFEDLDGFARWRVSLMEMSLAKLNLSAATEPIPNYGEGPDPYQCIQVHDYLSVSFLRQDPYAKKAASKAIELFGSYYPETLSRKFFVNVPTLMGWMFSAMKLVLSKETVKKFTVLTYGKDLAAELGQSVPEVYGGKGGKLEDAEQPRLQD